MTPILSILIPTTPDRTALFTAVYNNLHGQHSYMKQFHSTLGDIEILVDDSKRFLEGGLSIGEKRGRLLSQSTGKYVCYLDSDDWIAPNYLETLVRLCQYDKDVCTFRNLTKTEHYWTIIDMRLDNENEDAAPGRIINRAPWHICPIRRKYAKQVRFTNTNYGEDWTWLNQVLKMCVTEAHSEMILHEYRHGVHSQSDEILKAGYQ